MFSARSRGLHTNLVIPLAAVEAGVFQGIQIDTLEILTYQKLIQSHHMILKPHLECTLVGEANGNLNRWNSAYIDSQNIPGRIVCPPWLIRSKSAKMLLPQVLQNLCAFALVLEKCEPRLSYPRTICEYSNRLGQLRGQRKPDYLRWGQYRVDMGTRKGTHSGYRPCDYTCWLAI